jgi:sugar O-acyltransferase (sialic acid O-acetyltransferase NeuD family)
VSEKIVIIGASGHGRVVLDVLEQEGRREIIGFIDARRPAGETELGYPLLGSEEALPTLMASGTIDGFIVAIGDNWVREQVVNKVEAMVPGLTLVSAVHPAATLGRDVTIGAGSVLMAGVCVNPSSEVGRGCILNTRSSLDHDSTMGDFSSLAPGVTTGGNCAVGEGAAIGIGATLIHGVTVGEHTVIGAGSTVVRDAPAFVVAYGSPAGPVRERRKGDPYL